jgi:pilus assembly protein CpaE
MEGTHILVVEDSEITLFKLKAILVRLGYTVTTYSNPIEALEWLNKSKNVPDLILSDVNMPGMNGFTFVRKLRSLSATAQTPVIMLTSQTDMEDKIAGLQAGADDYLSKTVTPTELELRVKALLARTQTEEGTFTQSVAKTITVFSQRGGVGTTSLSVNLSIALAHLWGIDVCLWDMALSGGHCAYFLNMMPKNSLANLGVQSEESIDDNLLAQLILKHSSGLQLMPAPLSAAEAELVTPAIIDVALPYLQGHSSYLVIDAGNHFTDPVLTILERSDVILLVLSPEIASVKSAADALKIFDKLGFDLRKVLLIINDIFPNYQLPAKKIVAALKNRPSFEIPYDSEGFVKAITTGEPLITISPKSEVGAAIISLAYRLSRKQMEAEKKNVSNTLVDIIRKIHI